MPARLQELEPSRLAPGPAPAADGVECPRCGSRTVFALEKADPDGNTCFRCRPCGHIFSPRQ